MRPKAPALTALMLLAAPNLCALSIDQLRGTQLLSGTHREFAVGGEDLQDVTAASAFNTRGDALPIVVLQASAGWVEMQAALTGARVGFYTLALETGSGDRFEFPHLLELTDTELWRVAGTQATPIRVPFSAGSAAHATEVLVPATALPRPGTIKWIAVELEPGPDGDTAGAWVVRVKHSDLTEFPNDQLDAQEWLVVFEGTPVRSSDSDLLEFPLQTFFPHAGTRTLHVSILRIGATNSTPANLTRCFDAGAARRRSGFSSSALADPSLWTGSTPAVRELSSYVPVLHFSYLEPSVRAEFTPPPTARAGAGARFQDASVGNPDAWQWDFNADGVADRTEPSPTWVFPAAGSYRVELRVRRGSYADVKGTTVLVEPAVGTPAPREGWMAR